ncbi:zinc-binding dehydrogenase [Paraburkholderia sp. CNPSo 3281]|uniref:zinc-binding dehydrogenase n=1 Tax=Paraburkholderia sp. CNPSo 3281 TaxID=2940933 RepID=UPI0035CD3D06
MSLTIRNANYERSLCYPPERQRGRARARYRQAARTRIQLARMAGAKVSGVERGAEAYVGHASGDVIMIDASSQSIEEVVREKAAGHGADIVYNTVGSPYFEQAKALAKRGTQIFSSTIDRAVPFDIFAFYRGQHTYVGIDTLAIDSIEGATTPDQLLPSFESGALKPFPVNPDYVFLFENAVPAYQAVLRGTANRVLRKP